MFCSDPCMSRPSTFLSPQKVGSGSFLVNPCLPQQRWFDFCGHCSVLTIPEFHINAVVPDVLLMSVFFYTTLYFRDSSMWLHVSVDHFYPSVVFRCMNTVQLILSVLWWWASGFFPILAYSEKSCRSHSCMRLFGDLFSLLLGEYLRAELVGHRVGVMVCWRGLELASKGSFLPNAAFTHAMLAAWNRPSWEYFYQGDQQMPQIRLAFLLGSPEALNAYQYTTGWLYV